MRLNNRTTNPGELRNKVTLLTPAIARDAGGAQKATYSDFAVQPNIYAKIVYAHGQESVSSDALKSVSRMTLTIRYRSDVNATHAVRVNGEVWKFVGTPDNIQNRNEYLEIQAELVRATV